MVSLRFLPFLLLGLAVACRPDTTTTNSAGSEAPQQVKDDLGRTVTIPAHPRRIMALAPSMTEMLYAIADTSTIIARTQVCNYPAAVLRKPIINSYPLDVERLVALRPDVIFAVNGINSLDDAMRLEQLGIPVYFQQYETAEDVFRGMRNLGQLLGREEVARHLTDSLQAELRQLPPVAGKAPRVLAITWQDPIYVYGQNTLFTDKIRLAGGQNAVVEKFAQPYPALTREYILKLNPDVLLGGRFGKLDSTFFKTYPELRRIRAYQTKQVYPVTGSLMERPGPRTVESVQELRRILSAARPLAQ